MKIHLEKIPKIRLKPKFYLDLPENPGVYIYFKKGTPIYVGKAVNIKKRVSSYFRLNLDTKTQKMISEAEEMSFIKVDSEFDALLLEARLIKTFQPKYNIISKDDKHPLYILITDDQYPRILSARKLIANDQKLIASYGPFPSSTNVKAVLKMIRRTIPFSDHKLGKKACLYSQIGLCNPCPNEITGIMNNELRIMQTKKYKQNIKHIKAILDGRAINVIKELDKDMIKLSKEQKYEEAANTRNIIQKLNYIIGPKISVDSYLENPNFSEDLRKNELDDLGKILLKHKLKIGKLNRIECFDVAHLQGSGGAASMVTFIKGEPEKKYYRHFKIHQNNKNDDYASMKEVALRRKKHFTDWGKPDLIIVDGGKGQLSVFMNIFKDRNIPIVGLAKKHESLVIPVNYLGANTFKEYRMIKSPALNLVQRIRNEAHRFAQRYHHKLIKSSLFET